MCVLLFGWVTCNMFFLSGCISVWLMYTNKIVRCHKHGATVSVCNVFFIPIVSIGSKVLDQ